MIPQAWIALHTPSDRRESGQTVAGSTFSPQPKARQVSRPKHENFRKRMSPNKRKAQIVDAAAEVIAAKGFWGMSLQDVSDKVGITEAALYHYIDSKNDLLSMVVEQAYDSPEADDFIYGSCAGTDCDGHRFSLFPRFCVNNVIYNLHRPEMVKLFAILNGEALSPHHPAHAYFTMRNQKFWVTISSMNWALPQGYDLERFHHLWVLCMSAMDGLQYRWLADGSADLLEEWYAFSNELFGPEWHGLLDPSELANWTGCVASFGLQSSVTSSLPDVPNEQPRYIGDD